MEAAGSGWNRILRTRYSKIATIFLWKILSAFKGKGTVVSNYSANCSYFSPPFSCKLTEKQVLSSECLRMDILIGGHPIKGQCLCLSWGRAGLRRRKLWEQEEGAPGGNWWFIKSGSKEQWLNLVLWTHADSSLNPRSKSTILASRVENNDALPCTITIRTELV